MPAFQYESCFQRVDQVRPLHGPEPRANKPDDKLFHRVSALRAARILEDCTADIFLVELGEILDGAVERVD